VLINFDLSQLTFFFCFFYLVVAGEVMSEVEQFVIEYSDKRTVRLKFKGDQSDLFPWQSIELKFGNRKEIARKV
jgi:hypothetical protein